MRINCLLWIWLETSTECVRYSTTPWQHIACKINTCCLTIIYRDTLIKPAMIWKRSNNTIYKSSFCCSVKSYVSISVLSLQRSAVLEHIWNQDDTWPTSLCRAFILQWASILESKVHIWKTNDQEIAPVCVGFNDFNVWMFVSAEEAPADWWMARDGWGKTAWSD